LTVLGGLVYDWNQSFNSAATIINCKGQIPERTACLIKPSSYKINTYRVDICQRSPFPDYRSSADYSGAGCMTLFNGKGKLYEGQFAKVSKYKIPIIGRESMKPGKYTYLSIVLKNAFTSSGKYSSGTTTWRTAGKNAKNLDTSPGKPVEFTTKLTNWRGQNNKNNDYCENDGGTFSRCEINYNGYQSTGIGLDYDFIESYGSKVDYIFYMVRLSSPIILNEDSNGDFTLRVKNDLEVYGDGSSVKSISIPPFIFEANYNK
tara:strand:+ start:1005 stop:1787 length:783 start_codon:yes stop_codon:yes gene_type:complete